MVYFVSYSQACLQTKVPAHIKKYASRIKYSASSISEKMQTED